MQIEIQVLDKHFYLKRPFLKKFCRKVVENAWQGCTDEIVSVVLADNRFVQQLNHQYRGKTNPQMCFLLKMSTHWQVILLLLMVLLAKRPKHKAKLFQHILHIY